MCSICKRDGHLKDECPEDFKKIELKPLPPMTERFREILDGLCRLCYCEIQPSPLRPVPPPPPPGPHRQGLCVVCLFVMLQLSLVLCL